MQNGTIQVDVNGNWVECKNADDVKWIKICGSNKGTSMTTDGKALVAGGEEYPICEPKKQDKGEIIEASWETVDSYTVQDVSVNPMKGFSKMNLQGLDYDSMRGSKGFTPSISGAATALETVVNAIQFGLDSTSTTDYTISLQKQNAGTPNEKTRAVINIGESSDKQARTNLVAGKEYSLMNDIGAANSLGPNNETGKQTAQILAQRAYEEYTGEKPNATKTYDIIAVYDEGYIKSPSKGTISKGDHGGMVYTPDLNGVSMYIVEREWWGGESKRIPLVKNSSER